ncbi:hypothetical protein CRV24_000107 [Beauveria bassiana]|uniref:Uncharacterized protein n=1 Tax=Beauveria bassiana (strain ARSEF 2860) TaxID=655819 RepID=J5J4Z4_BEAB2|nr:uncharacterized protein BBA_09344 [Beauveria bassiana ARSEF 2860]EJP61703.1 hypothetical protein BBA_09344 [Beauveria bassiana ARSEF 2860]KAF1738185.1 hypothetical protein CRV24_000107 [Beauveria bassiana]KAH8721376.1 hypothetical protein HC256_001734 [Beauveria bassiana]
MAVGLILAALVAGAYCTPALAPRIPFGEADMAQLARDTPAAKYNTRRILSVIEHRNAPYMEVPMSELKGLGDSFKKDWDEIAITHLGDYNRAFILRSQMVPGSAKFKVHINPNIEKEVISGHGPTTYTVTSSTAKIDTDREGWNTDTNSEVGGSVTADVHFNGLFVSGGVSATVTGNHRWGEGKNGEKSKQTEFRTDEEMRQECPPRHFCSVQTWTYTVEVSGQWQAVPVFQVDSSPAPNFANLALPKADYCLAACNPYYENCQDMWKLAGYFYELGEVEDTPRYNYEALHQQYEDDPQATIQTLFPIAAEKQGDTYMPADGIIYGEKLPHVERKLSYTLRKANGEPYRTVVVVSEPLEKEEDSEAPEDPEATEDSDESDDGKVAPPRALEWVVGRNGVGMCKLDEGWWCSKEWRFYDPENGWFTADAKDWDQPEDLDKNCPQIRAPPPAERDIPESDWKKLPDSTEPEIAHHVEMGWAPTSRRNVPVVPDLKAGEWKRSFNQTNSTQAAKVEVVVLQDELSELVADLENGTI